MPRTTNKLAPAHHRSGRWITERKRFAIYHRDGMKCVYCEGDISGLLGTSGVTLDHLDSHAGNSPANLVTACKRCNDSKSGLTVSEFVNDKAVLSRIESQRRQPLDEFAGQALYEARTGTKDRETPELPPISTNQAAALIQMSTAEMEIRIERGDFVRGPKGMDVVSLVQRALQIARRTAQVAGDTAEAGNRKRIAEAESAEMNAAKDKGQTLLKKDVELIWADYFAQQREALAHMPGITDKQRRVVSEKLLAIKISEDISK